MPKLVNPLEGTHYDPRHAEIAVVALKRGHNAEGDLPIEVYLENIGEVAVLGSADRQQIEAIVSGEPGNNSAQTLGDGIEGVLVNRIAQQRIALVLTKPLD